MLLYAYDRAAGSKHLRARDLVEQLWNENRGLLSTQVLQEFYVNVRRKTRPAVSRAEARALVADYLAWNPVVNDGAAVHEAVDLGHRYQLSFWDALVVVAARKGGASVALLGRPQPRTEVRLGPGPESLRRTRILKVNNPRRGIVDRLVRQQRQPGTRRWFDSRDVEVQP